MLEGPGGNTESVYIVTHAFVANFISIWMCSFEFSIVTKVLKKNLLSAYITR